MATAYVVASKLNSVRSKTFCEEFPGILKSSGSDFTSPSPVGFMHATDQSSGKSFVSRNLYLVRNGISVVSC